MYVNLLSRRERARGCARTGTRSTRPDITVSDSTMVGLSMALLLLALPHAYGLRLRVPPFRNSSPSMQLAEIPLDSLGAFGAGALLGAFVGAVRTPRFDPSNKPTPLTEIYVRPGRGKYGAGLICVREVPAGGRICKCYPIYSKTVSMASLDKLPPEVREVIHEMWDCVNDPPGTCLVPIDYDSALPLIAFVNHDARQPNCYYDEETNSIRAIRKLKKGEEATVNYFDYQDENSYTYLHAASGFNSNYIETVYPKSARQI